MSIFVSGSAISSSGLSSDLLVEELKGKGILANQEDNITVDIAESATGDHYVELGGEAGPRSFGKRTVGGIIIR